MTESPNEGVLKGSRGRQKKLSAWKNANNGLENEREIAGKKEDLIAVSNRLEVIFSHLS